MDLDYAVEEIKVAIENIGSGDFISEMQVSICLHDRQET